VIVQAVSHSNCIVHLGTESVHLINDRLQRQQHVKSRLRGAATQRKKRTAPRIAVRATKTTQRAAEIFIAGQETGWEERLRNDLFCVELEVKP